MDQLGTSPDEMQRAEAVLLKRIAELEAIARSQKTMLDEIAEAAGFRAGDTYSAASIVAAPTNRAHTLTP